MAKRAAPRDSSAATLRGNNDLPQTPRAAAVRRVDRNTAHAPQATTHLSTRDDPTTAADPPSRYGASGCAPLSVATSDSPNSKPMHPSCHHGKPCEYMSNTPDRCCKPRTTRRNATHPHSGAEGGMPRNTCDDGNGAKGERKVHNRVPVIPEQGSHPERVLCGSQEAHGCQHIRCLATVATSASERRGNSSDTGAE